MWISSHSVLQWDVLTSFAARKRSLGQGNIFTGMCQSFCPWRGGSQYDVTFCLAAWSHVPSRGVLCAWLHVPSRGSLSKGTFSKGVSVQEGLCLGSLSTGISVQGALCQGNPGQRPPCTVKSKWYTSYWNALLFLCVYFTINLCT